MNTNTINERNAIAASSATSWSSDRHSGYGTFVLPASGAALVGTAMQVTGAEAATPCAPIFGATAGFSLTARKGADIADIALGTHAWSPPT